MVLLIIILIFAIKGEVHVVDIEKKIIVHKIITNDDVCFLHWSQESTDTKNRYEEYLRIVSCLIFELRFSCFTYI